MPHKFATAEAEFSGIEGQVYNTKFNRGVHSATGTEKVGGTANAISVDRLLADGDKEQKSVPDQGAACILASFYAPYRCAVRSTVCYSFCDADSLVSAPAVIS